MSAANLAVEIGVGQSGPVGLVIVLVLAGAGVLLFRSMNKHIHRIPDSFDEPTPARDEPSGDAGPGADGSGTDARGTGARGRGDTPPGSPPAPHR